MIGGAGVVLRGHVRPIADLDIAIDPTPDEMNRAMNVLYALGFVPTIPLPLNALIMLRLFDQFQREVNVFTRPHVAFAELWTGSDLIRTGHALARVASIEHLLRAKRIDGRPQDRLDINGLLTL